MHQTTSGPARAMFIVLGNIIFYMPGHCRLSFFFLLTLLLVTCLGIADASIFTKLPPKPEFTLEKILSADHLSAEVRMNILNVAGFGPSRLMGTGENWEADAVVYQKDMAVLPPGEVMPIAMRGNQLYNAAASISAYEIAIEKYRENPSSVKNDQKISDAYIGLGRTYERLSGIDRGYLDYQIQALNDATDAMPTNKNAWDQKIELLDRLGMKDEAAQAQADYNRIQKQTEAGYSFLGNILWEPLDPAVAVLAPLLAAALFLVWRRIGRQC